MSKATEPTAEVSRGGLRRELKTIDAAALVIGSVIGTGIFIKTAIMSQLLGGPAFVLLAWVIAALLSYAGALGYAELGSRYPLSGGEYAYLRAAYGDGVGFLYGWTRIWVGGPGSIASYAVGAATFLGGAFAVTSESQRSLVAVGLILIFTLLNCLTVKTSGRIQVALTFLKVVMILGIVAGIFLFGEGVSWSHWRAASAESSWPGLSAFGAALVAALWAFDGWNNLPMVGGELKNASRAFPIALGLGMAVVAGAYLLANVAYFYALPFGQILAAHSSAHPEALPVATIAAGTFLGHAGVAVMSVIFTVSAVGAMHGSLLSGARIPFAMAEDGLMFRFLARIHPRTHSPIAGVLLQGFVGCVLALSGTFDQLTDAVVFSSWIFYALATASLFKLRRQDAREKKRGGFLAPGYPFVPIIFIVVSVALLVNTVWTNPFASLLGLGVIALGIPVYLLLVRIHS